MIPPYIESLGVTFCVFALLAYSFALPISTGVLFAGQMGTMALAAYVTALSLLRGMPPVVAVLLGVVAAVLLGALLIRPALRLGELSMAIVTLGVSQIVVTLASNLDVTNRSLGLRDIPSAVGLPSAAAALLICIGALLVARRRGLLRLARMVREDPRVAQSCGIDVRRVRAVALVTGALLSGIAGSIYAAYLTYVSPAAFGFYTLLQIIAFALIGGVVSPYGALLGTGLLWLVPQFIPALGEWRFIAYAVVVIVVTVYRPTGLLGDRQPQLELADDQVK